MFPYDDSLFALASVRPGTIPEVIELLGRIDNICIEGDGLKWFNGLYLEVTRTVQGAVAAGQFNDPAWLATIDVQFAQLYCSALSGFLEAGDCPSCWKALFSSRADARVARIQFALAGVNAHINHDLPEAIVTTSTMQGTVPQHGSPQFQDYMSLQPILNNLVESAKRTLHVRLLGDPLPAVSHLENTLTGWCTLAAREQAWDHAEVLWHLRNFKFLTDGFLKGLDGLTTFGNKALLAPVH